MKKMERLDLYHGGVNLDMRFHSLYCIPIIRPV